MSQQPDDSTASARPASVASPGREGAVGRSSVKVRRAPRYYRFMLVGLVLGVLIALVLTFAFPEQDDFTRLQVFGFTGIFLVAVFAALGAVVAIALDRASTRRARTVAAEYEEHDAPAPAPGVSTDAAVTADATDAVEYVQLRDEDRPRDA